MISNIDIIVQEKWKLASEAIGAGTTTAIGSINSIEQLKKGQSYFKSEEEFKTYWLNIGEMKRRKFNQFQ